MLTQTELKIVLLEKYLNQNNIEDISYWQKKYNWALLVGTRNTHYRGFL